MKARFRIGAQVMLFIVLSWSLLEAQARGPGSWVTVLYDAQVLAVHAALLDNGKILYWGGSQNDPDKPWGIDNTRIYDPVTNMITAIGSPTDDIFCAGHAQLGDGRIAVVGGTDAYAPQGKECENNPNHLGYCHFPGTRSLWLLDPTSNKWSEGPEMNTEPFSSQGGGRWYPTTITLHNGSVLAISGHPLETDSRHNNNSPETWGGLAGDPWKFLADSDEHHESAYYPRMFLLPNRRVLSVTPIWDDTLGTLLGTQTLVTSTPAQWEKLTDEVPAGEWKINWDLGNTAVLLPLRHEDGFTPRVLVLGDREAHRLDPASRSPQWYKTSPRTLSDQPVRFHASSVLLPTGEVLLTGGVVPAANGAMLDVNGVKTAEIYNPETDRWSTAAPARFVRQYHSVALLMSDGGVWVAGSNIDKKNSQVCWSGLNDCQLCPGDCIDYRRKEIEIYRPWYYDRSDRPQILRAPSRIHPGETFIVAADIAFEKVVLMRAGSATHGFDFDQRYISLKVEPPPPLACEVGDPFPSPEPLCAQATAPPDNYVTPPGYYMLFLVNSAGVPSKGTFVKMEDTSSVHRANDTDGTNVTHLDDPFANKSPGASILVTPRLEPPFEAYSPNPIGVWYNPFRQRWAIYDESRAPIPRGAAFDVKIEGGSLGEVSQGAPRQHMVTNQNRNGNSSEIDDPKTNDNPNALVILAHNFTPPLGGVYNPHNVGIWYNTASGRWAIYNEDLAEMPLGTVFNYRVDGGAFLHETTPWNIYSYWSWINHPRLDDRPAASVLVTHNWNPGGMGNQYNDSALGVAYDYGQQQWAVFNQSRLPMKEGLAFNLLILN